MRSFGIITADTRCVACGVSIIAVPDTGVYQKQTVVTYTDCDVQFPYCSNRCVNTDSERAGRIAEAHSHLFAHMEAAVLNEVFDAHAEALAVNELRDATHATLNGLRDDFYAKRTAALDMAEYGGQSARSVLAMHASGLEYTPQTFTDGSPVD